MNWLGMATGASAKDNWHAENLNSSRSGTDDFFASHFWSETRCSVCPDVWDTLFCLSRCLLGRRKKSSVVHLCLSSQTVSCLSTLLLEHLGAWFTASVKEGWMQNQDQTRPMAIFQFTVQDWKYPEGGSPCQRRSTNRGINYVLNLTNIAISSAIAICIVYITNNHTYYPGAGYPHQAGDPGTGSNVQ